MNANFNALLGETKSSSPRSVYSSAGRLYRERETPASHPGPPVCSARVHTQCRGFVASLRVGPGEFGDPIEPTRRHLVFCRHLYGHEGA